MKTENETTKVCSKCGIEKPLNEFVKSKVCLLGRSNTCISCRNNYERLRYNPEVSKSKYLSNRITILEKNKDYRERNKDKVNEQSRIRYRLNHPKREPLSEEKRAEMSKLKRKLWADSNKDKIKGYKSKWEKNNPVYMRAKQRVASVKRTERCTDSYMRSHLIKTDRVGSALITPELIELKRIIIKTKRLCKQK